MSKEPPKHERNPDRLRVDGDWEKAVKKALNKPKPKEGWPEPELKRPKRQSKPKKGE
ncbi:MAG TPA: hypothetical protein PK400_07380 [Phycisphaerales bacterium]|nr:hypothetical protein [Phycisphaerales bacterium]HRQ76444.1 hypothetical protein [Phycisphaerales bacterium]